MSNNTEHVQPQIEKKEMRRYGRSYIRRLRLLKEKEYNIQRRKE